MNLNFSVFFDIDNLDDFFYSILFPTASSKNSVKVTKCENIPLLTEQSNILDCTRVAYKNKSSLVIYKDNLIDGGWTYINKIAKTFNVRTLYIRIKDDVPYPAYYLAYFDKNSERIIYNIKENRWKFYQHGPVAFFEENDKYQEKKISDKFNMKKILTFCERLGINVLEDNFFTPASPVFCMKRYL